MISDISCTKARELLNQGAQLVDVRSQMEFQRGALPGAVNVPLEVINGAHQHLDSDRPVILYCVTGRRSGHAKMLLQSMGYESVHNLGSFRNFHSC